MTTTCLKFRSLSSSLNSAILLTERCKARRRGKGPRFARLLRPLSSIRNSRNERRPSKAFSSICLTLFLSSTSSLSCSMRDSPSIFVRSLPGRCKIRSDCNGNCEKKLISVMPLLPSSRTCKCGIDPMPPTASPSANIPFSKSIFVRFILSTSNLDRGPTVFKSVNGLPFKLNSRNDGKMSSFRNCPSSRKFWLERSTERKL
mmetsp:Transcript_48191/g.121404  ORF Transcript_48191/g.121404 Transcript_48191/m.121404 type:complete len:202 (+) Transcript_48191:404-1009(+)